MNMNRTPIVLVAEILSLLNFNPEWCEVCKKWAAKLCQQRNLFQHEQKVNQWFKKMSKLPFVKLEFDTIIPFQTASELKKMPTLKKVSLAEYVREPSELMLLVNLPIFHLRIIPMDFRNFWQDIISFHHVRQLTLLGVKISNPPVFNHPIIVNLESLNISELGRKSNVVPSWVQQCVSLKKFRYSIDCGFHDDKLHLAAISSLPVEILQISMRYSNSPFLYKEINVLKKTLKCLKVRCFGLTNRERGYLIPHLDLPFLEILDLEEFVNNEQDLQFKNLPNLKSLSLRTKWKFNYSDSDRKWLEELLELEELHLFGGFANFTNHQFSQLANCKKLRKLSMTQNLRNRLWNNLKSSSLTSFNFSCFSLRLGILASLDKVTNLRSLSITQKVKSGIPEEYVLQKVQEKATKITSVTFLN